MVRRTLGRRHRAARRARRSPRAWRSADPAKSFYLARVLISKPASTFEEHALDRFQVRLERIDRHAERGVTALTPQIAAVETDGIEPLRVFALPLRVGVGKHVAA